jgi:hypothetical protein
MILPNKYVKPSQSLLGISALILEMIGDKRYQLDYVWYSFKEKYICSGSLKSDISYNKFILCLTFMYMQKMINYDKNGVIYNENLELKNI